MLYELMVSLVIARVIQLAIHKGDSAARKRLSELQQQISPTPRKTPKALLESINREVSDIETKLRG